MIRNYVWETILCSIFHPLKPWKIIHIACRWFNSNIYALKLLQEDLVKYLLHFQVQFLLQNQNLA